MALFYRDPPPNSSSPDALPYNTVRPITASAARVNTNSKKDSEALRNRLTNQRWQQDAWYYYDAIGEIQYAFNLFANVISRVKIYAGYVTDDQDTPTPIKVSTAPDEVKEATEDAVNYLFGGGRQPTLLKKAALNMLVAGECYLINEQITTNGYVQKRWRIVSVDELVPLGTGFAIRPRESVQAKGLTAVPSNTFIGRMWREHPRFSDEPDASMKSLCSLCDELLLLGRTVRAASRSRLPAGALFVPDVFSVSREVASDTVTEDVEEYLEDEQDEFEEELVDHFMTPISEEDSAAAQVPLIIRGPIDAGEKIRHITFERSSDPGLKDRQDRTLERILQGLDLPKELVAGLANVKYNNAAVIDQMFYTAHIEPLVLMLCDMFRVVFLERYLYQKGISPEEIEKVVFWYDPSGITTAPDRSAAANVGFDKFAISEDAWRSANGFDEDDAPSTEELIKRLALSRGVLTPEMTDTIFSQLFPELAAQTRERTQDQQSAPLTDNIEQLIDPATTAAPPPEPDGIAPEAGSAPAAPSTGPTPEAPEGLLEP